MTVSNLTDALITLDPVFFDDRSSPGTTEKSILMQFLLGYVADVSAQELRDAKRLNLLSQDGYPYDYLAVAGVERNIPRWAGLSDEQYRQNLLDAWNVWLRAGTPSCIEQQISLMGLDARVTDDHMDISRFPSSVDYPSQFNVVIRIDGFVVKWDDGLLWDSGWKWDEVSINNRPSEAQLQSVREITAKFKDVFWICRDIVYEIGGVAVERFNPDIGAT